MKKLLAKVKESKGFVSLEVIVIAVIVIALAAFIMLNFRDTADNASDTANSQINDTVNAINTDADGTFKEASRK